MKRIIAALTALTLLLGTAAVSEAGWYPGKKLVQGVAERRAEGKGIGQKNGPAKRLVRGTR